MEITEEVLDVIALTLSQDYEKNESYVPQDVKELVNCNFISCSLEGGLGVIDFLKGILRDDEAMIEVLKRLFKSEQDPEVTCKKDKKEEKKDKFQLCVVQGGEEIVNAEVTTDEFIGIMHEQAREEN